MNRHRSILIHRPSLIVRYGSIAILFSTFTILSTAQPPELTILRQHYERVLAERVTAVFDASLAELNAKFITALTSAATTAKQAGKLDDILAIQDDQKRLADKIPLPDDAESTPEALKKLRGIYGEQLKKLEDTRTANHSALLPAYTAKLTALEATLVQNDRIDEAKELRMYREGLLTGSVPAASAPVAAAPAAPASSVIIPNAAKREIPAVPPEKEREAALAILKLGPAEIKAEAADGKEVTITSPETLPAGVIQITLIRILGLTEGKSRVGKMLTPLAGLSNLKTLILQHFPLHDDDMDAIGALPSLREISIDFARSPTFTGKNLHLLAAPEKLFKANFSECTLGKPSFEALGRFTNLYSLGLAKTGITDDDLKNLATLTQLKNLDLRSTDTSVFGLRHLTDLTLLDSFGWSPDPKAEKGGFAELAILFPQMTSLKLSRRPGAKAVHYAGISLMPNLKQVIIEADNKPGDLLEGVAAAPQVEYLRGYLWGGVQDADLIPLQTALGITKVNIDLSDTITGKGLMHFSKMPKLKELSLTRFKKITDADIAEFKRIRPDVAVKHTK